MLDMNAKPTEEIDLREVFGLDSDMKVKGFAERTERVPDIDSTYKFDPDTTMAILAGFAYNRRVMIQGYHGTGKSTHIEQVAARLNWPCIRVNLDGHISRIDLVGKDAIVLKDGKGSRENYKGAALGEGDIHLDHAVACLRKAGYDGAWTAEYEGPEAEGGVGYEKCYKWLQTNVPV